MTPIRWVAVALAVATIAGWSSSVAGAAQPEPAIGFRPVLAQVPPEGATTTTGPVDLDAARTTVASCDVGAVQQLAAVPTTSRAAARPDRCVVFPDAPGGDTAPRSYLGPAADVGMAAATAEFVAGQGWTVRFRLTKAGARAWDQLARQQFHRQVAVTHQGLVVSAPTIQPQDASFTSFGGTAVVSGAFDRKQARALAAAVNRHNAR
jgi:preprotein translocase subunit SecD